MNFINKWDVEGVGWVGWVYKDLLENSFCELNDDVFCLVKLVGEIILNIWFYWFWYFF